jgi:hypothetical protein
VPSAYAGCIGVEEAGEFEAAGEPSAAAMLSLEELRPKTVGAEVGLGDA